VLRNLVLGRTAIALRDADLRQRGGDVGGALIALDGQLAFAREARARLVASGEATRAATIDEPLALLVRTRGVLAATLHSAPARASDALLTAPLTASAPLTSAAYAEWGASTSERTPRGSRAGDD
jgi:hypothetical protein